jgi:hypothetical protein
MDLTYVHAVAAFSGSASGTVATILTGLSNQRREDRALRRSHAMSQRQELYKSFVEEASRFHADALINEASERSRPAKQLTLLFLQTLNRAWFGIEESEHAANWKTHRS